jgi:hypothetical protein
MANPENFTVTVTVTDFNPDAKPLPTATFTYSGDGIDGKTIKPKTGVVSVYTFIPLQGSPWTEAPFTPAPAAGWLQLDSQDWIVTVDGTSLQQSASAGFKVSVVLSKVTYVDDPTIIMVDPPG